MIIQGEKIILRAVEAEDNAMLLSLINDPDTEMMLGGSSWPVSENDQLKWFEQLERTKDSLRCIVALPQDTRALGTVILSEIDQKNGTAHIHIKMAKEGRGKGYAAEAINLLTAYAFNELRLHCMYANILAYNDASINLFEKCGFQRDGLLRARVYKQGKYIDMYAYSRLSDE